MGSLNKSAELNALRELRTNLKGLEDTQKAIVSIESSIRNLSTKSYDNTRGYQLSTNHYEQEASKYISIKKAKKQRILNVFWTFAILILITLGVGWLCLSGVFTKSTYLHTPEIVKEYTGVYYSSVGDKHNAALTITSCSEQGDLEGYFEFSRAKVSGKYAIKGKVTSKSKEGYVTATIKAGEWIDRPSGYNPLRDMEIKIYDNFQVLRGSDYDMRLYAADYKQPTIVTDLETPEIVKEYSGEFTPNTGKVGTASITINSCNTAGEVTGVFFYSFESSTHSGNGKWELTGQIIQKYSNGSVKLRLVPSKEISSNYMFYYPSTMEVEISDNYRSFESQEGMHWFYEDEGLTEDPNPVKTPTEQMVSELAPIVFPAYLAFVFVLAVILHSKKTNVFTAQERQKLDELIKLDSQHKKENEIANKERIAKAKKDDQQQLANYREMLENTNARHQEFKRKVNQSNILAPSDKTLSNVEFLIYRMESNRADSVKEALLQLDDSNRRSQEARLRMDMERLEADRRARAEADAYWNQTMHNIAVEREQRRQSDELERIRKALED